MEAGGVGVNSPEFLQKKIERLKTALDEANVLMDRQVTERDGARAQLESVKRENDDLRRELADAQARIPSDGGGAPAADPEVERQLRERIAQLERERTSLQAAQQAEPAQPGDESQLQGRIASLQGELDESRRQLDLARSDLENSRRDVDAARRDA